jgi:hypothetical protein
MPLRFARAYMLSPRSRRNRFKIRPNGRARGIAGGGYQTIFR